MNSRRNFLKMLRFAPAAPLAAKAAADRAIADMAGIPGHGAFGVPAMSGTISGGEPQALNQDSWKNKVLRFLAQNKLPDWIDDHLRENHRQVGYIDPDIASKCSWSFNVKVATQRERNIQRAKRDLLEGPRRGLRSREFEQTWGVWV